MNFRYYLAIFFLSFTSTFVNGQAIQIRDFSFSSSVWNNSTKTLTVKRTGQSTYLTSVALSRINLPEWTSAGLSFNIEIEAFAKKKNNGQLVKISDEIKFTTDDFIGTTSTTIVKYPTLTIPAGFIDEDGGTVVIKWRYYKKNYPSPYDVEGWTDWYTANAEINLKLEDQVLPPSTISGPDQICDEGTYTITNPGIISLENADGIATLTDLGNNQWKVSKIGLGSGKIALVSSVSENIYKRSIIIGDAQFVETTINGPSMAIWEQEHEIEIVPPTVQFDYDINVTLEQNRGRAQLIKVDDLNYKLKVFKLEAYPDMPEFGDDFIIAARFKNQCGNYEYKRFNIKAANNTNPGQGGID